MSAPKYQVIVALPAQQDFRDILSFTQQTWGGQKRLEYKRKIDVALKAIIENPYRGRKRHGRMVYGAGRRKIYYVVKDTTIYVLRILHDRMDAVRHLRED